MAARRQLQGHPPRPEPRVRGLRGGPLLLRRGRQPLPRLHAERDQPHHGPRQPHRRRSHRRAGGTGDRLRRPEREGDAPGAHPVREGAVARQGALRELRHRGHAQRDSRRPHLHRQAQDRQVLRRVPRLARVRLRQREAVDRPVRTRRSSGDAGVPRPASEPAGGRGRPSLERPRDMRADRPAQRERPRLRDHGAHRLHPGLPADAARFPRGHPCPHDRPRHAARVRRGADPAHLARRRTGVAGRGARSDRHGQDGRRRPSRGRLRGPRRHHGAVRPARRCGHSPRRDIQRQPADHGRGRGHPQPHDPGCLRQAQRPRRDDPRKAPRRLRRA